MLFRSNDGMVRWSQDGGKYILRFEGELTDRPVLSDLSRRFNVSFNIRAAGIQPLPQKKLGTMLVDFDGEAAEISRALAHLTENGIVVEEANAGEVE
mgnify:FL=1